MDFCFLQESDRDEWNTFVSASPYGHVLQSWEWGEVKERTGWRAHRLAGRQDGRIVGAAQILVRPLPYGLGRLGLRAEGPRARLRRPGLTLRDAGRVAGCRPRASGHHVEDQPEITEPSPVSGILAEAGLRPSSPVQMRSTIWVDLTGSEEEIMGRQKQKTRYNIRLAGRKGVTVECGGVRDLPAWYAMFRATAERDAFTIHGIDYYRHVLEILGSRNLARLLLARHEGDLLAGIIVFRFGHLGQYMYGASSNEKRNLMAPYLAQWEGMRWARAEGATVYDLWGIPDRLEENEDLWGVYRHKRGYGGEIKRYLGAFDVVRSPVQHAALERVARPLFKRVARLGV